MAHIDTCGANLCAESAGNDKRGWYPGEPICTAHGAVDLRWNRNQRKIAKIHAKRPVEGCFSFAMLDGTFTVRQGICGIDDERSRTRSEADWIADHHWTPEQVARAAAQGVAARARLPQAGHSSGRNAAAVGEGLSTGTILQRPTEPPSPAADDGGGAAVPHVGQRQAPFALSAEVAAEVPTSTMP